MSVQGFEKQIRDILTQFQRAYESLRKGAVTDDMYNFGEHGPLVETSVPSEYEILEQYWVNVPFSFVSVFYNPEDESNIYHVSTPALTEFEQELLENLRQDVRDQFLYVAEDPDISSEQGFIDITKQVLIRYGLTVDVQTFYKILYYLMRDFQGFGKLQPILDDPHIEDISCDGPNTPIFIYHDEYDNIKTNIQFNESNAEDLVIQLAQASGQQVSVGRPITNATLPDGSRAELIFSDEVSPNGSAFTIRKYSEETMTPAELINFNTFSIEQMVYFWLAIEYNKNLIFAGGTASGKTTSLNAVSMFIPPRSKVITIEDTREMTLSHENWLSNVTREQNADEDIDMYDLLRSALRHRPEYMIVGEIRGEEASTLFQAMNTGHTTFSTMHADSVQTVINRLENNPIDIPRAMIQSLDILSVQQLVRVDGERERRSAQIAEIQGIEQRTGELNYSGLYQWDGQTDTFEGDLRGSTVLDDIREEQGWSERELLEEVRNRQIVLKYLFREEMTDLKQFTAVIKRYARDPESTLRRAKENLESEPDVISDQELVT